MSLNQQFPNFLTLNKLQKAGVHELTTPLHTDSVELTVRYTVAMICRVLATVSYLLCCLTTETENYDTENSFMGNLAVLKCNVNEHRE